MKYLVTGGAGFIGSYVSRALWERGDQVVVLDNFNEFLYPATLKRARVKHFLNSPAVDIVEGSILDDAVLKDLFKTHSFDAIIHLAALANPRFSLEAEEAYHEVNVLGTLKLLKAAHTHRIKKFIFAGSSSVYNDEQAPFTEDSYPLRPRSPYGASKAAAESYCALWHDLHGLSVIVLRFFSVYGPWGRPDMAPMVFAEKILKGQPIEVTRQPRQRDFTYIDDIIPAVLASTSYDAGFEIFNIGRGEPVNLGDLIIALEAAAGQTAKLVERDAPPGEMRITYADTSKAQRQLGYAPSISVGQGARELVTWMREWYLQQ